MVGKPRAAWSCRRDVIRRLQAHGRTVVGQFIHGGSDGLRRQRGIQPLQRRAQPDTNTTSLLVPTPDVPESARQPAALVKARRRVARVPAKTELSGPRFGGSHPNLGSFR